MLLHSLPPFALRSCRTCCGGLRARHTQESCMRRRADHGALPSPDPAQEEAGNPHPRRVQCQRHDDDTSNSPAPARRHWNAGPARRGQARPRRTEMSARDLRHHHRLPAQGHACVVRVQPSLPLLARRGALPSFPRDQAVCRQGARLPGDPVQGATCATSRSTSMRRPRTPRRR